ncbi:hypothetical protein LguiA_035079 [Lonicera macranthoides]
MNLTKIHGLHPSPFHISQTTVSKPSLFFPHLSSPPTHKAKFSLSLNSLSTSTLPSKSPISPVKHRFVSRVSRHVRTLRVGALSWESEGERSTDDTSTYLEDLTPDGEVYKKTLRLVECSMFAALGGLAYLLSSSLAIENYFGCFFALPIVFSSMRWGMVAGRKTMVATATLLLVLSGPVKALTYLLMHGLLGLTMGSLWRSRASWRVSIPLSAFVRAIGAMGYVVTYSFLIRENILALITINIHASLTYALTALGLYSIPSMNTIYAIFGTLLLFNCGFFVFLLHLLYSLFFTKLGMKGSLTLPRWLEKAT